MEVLKPEEAFSLWLAHNVSLTGRVRLSLEIRYLHSYTKANAGLGISTFHGKETQVPYFHVPNSNRGVNSDFAEMYQLSQIIAVPPLDIFYGKNIPPILLQPLPFSRSNIKKLVWNIMSSNKLIVHRPILC